MTIYDVAMAAVLIAGMVRGAWRGITWQLASIGSLVLGYLFSYPVSALIAPKMPGTPEAARALSMAAAYVVVSTAVFGVAWLVRNVISKLKFNAFDRHLGMMLGGIEGVTVGILATILVASVAPKTRDAIFTSPTGKLVNGLVSRVGPVLPGEIRNALAPFWNEVAPVAASDSDADQDQDAAPEAVAEASSRRDPNVQAVAARAASRLDAQFVHNPDRDLADLPPVEAGDEVAAESDADPDELPSAREFLGQLVEEGKRRAEQTVVESLDVDPGGKAGTLRELYEKDKARIQSAVAGTVEETRRNLTGQVSGAVEETKRNVVDQVQGRAGRLQGKAGDVQKQVGQVRSRVAQTQDQVIRARQRLEQGVDGAVDQGRKRLEQSLTDAIDKGLDKLGLPEPAPEKAP